MIGLQLYVENQLVEMFEDESVTLTQTIQDVKNIDKIFSDFSKTFSVPASETNNKIFKHFYNFEILDGFDARKKIDAELYLNYKLFKKGKVKLEGSTLKINKAHTYRLTFFGNTVNLKDKIGDIKLSGLSTLTALEFEYSDTNIKALLNTPQSKTMNGVVFPKVLLVPLITHTKRLIYDSGTAVANTETQANIAFNSVGTNKGLEFDQLKPAIRVHAIIKAIETEFFSADGFSFSKDFFSSSNPSYYNLYLWLHNKVGSMFSDQPEQVKFTNFTEVSKHGDKKNSVIDLNKNNFVNPSRLSRGEHNDRTRRLRFSVAVTNQSAKYNIYVFRDGELLLEYKDLVGDSFPTKNQGSGKGENAHYIFIQDGIYTFAVESDTVATFTISPRVKTEPENRFGSIGFTGTAVTITNKKVQITEQIPNIKVIDFLTGIFKMFNLTAFIQDDKVIKIQTLDNFYDTNTVYRDITEFVDKDTSMVDSVLPYKQVNFSYKGDQSFLAANFNQIFNKKWGALNYNATKKFDGEVYRIELPFDHFQYERLNNVTGGAQTSIQWGWSVDDKQGAFLPEPLLFYPVLSSGTSISFMDSAGNDSEVTSYFVPSNSLYLSNTLTDDSSDNINFHSENNEYLGIPFNKTLFEKYYKTYIQDVFDKRRRLTKVKTFLPISVLQNLSLADKLIIFNKLYKINKVVTNFETLISDLELINTANKIIEIIPSKFLPVSIEGNLTTDTTEFTADNGIITVDKMNNFEGLQELSTTEVVPEDVSVSNIPQVVVSGEPLVVTPPILTYLTTSPTSSVVTISFTVTTLGKVGTTPQIDEYGFFYSTTKSDLTSTSITTLKSGSATNIKYETTPQNKNTLSGDIKFQITGLSAGDTIYYRFYGITTNDTSFDVASGESLSAILHEQATPSLSFTTTTSTYLYNVQKPGGSQRGAGNTTFRIKNGDGTFFDVKGFSGPSLISFIVPVVIEGDAVQYEQRFYGSDFTGISTHNTQHQYDVDTNNQFERDLETCGYHATDRATAESYAKSPDETGSSLPNGTKLTRLAFYNQGLTSETDFVCQNYRPLKEGFGLMQLPEGQFGVYQKNTESNKLLYAPDGFYAFYDCNQNGCYAPSEGVSGAVVDGIVTNVQTFY